MVDYADDIEYARTRLNGSVVLHEGYPYLVEKISNDGIATLLSVHARRMKLAYIKELNNSDIPLGFMNTYEGLRYLVRQPKKQWKQGLRKDTVVDLINGGNCMPDGYNFLNCVTGRYPSLTSAIEMIECGEHDKVAFSRSLAVGKKLINGYQLIYKQFGAVGAAYISDSGLLRFTLDENYEWLQEEVEGVWKDVA